MVLTNQNHGPPAERPMALPLGIDEGAPTPPPRKPGHSRSSSLDNQLLDLDESKGIVNFQGSQTSSNLSHLQLPG